MSVEANMAVGDNKQETKTTVWGLLTQYMDTTQTWDLYYITVYISIKQYKFDITLAGIPQQCIVGV